MKGLFLVTVLTTYGCVVSFMATRTVLHVLLPHVERVLDKVLPEATLLQISKLRQSMQEIIASRTPPLRLVNIENGSQRAGPPDSVGGQDQEVPLGEHKPLQPVSTRSGTNRTDMADQRRSSLSMLLFFRLLPIVPSWFLNAMLSVVGSNLPEFIISVAIGYLPFNIYSLWVGTSLTDVTCEPELNNRQLLLGIMCITFPSYFILVRSDPVATVSQYRAAVFG